MGVKSLRNMNLAGTILFALIGGLLISSNFYSVYRYSIEFPEHYDSSLCITLLLIWSLIIIIFSILLYNYAVVGLDRGNYVSAKRWTLIGIIVGFAGGIIPLILFIISYVSFDDAIRDEKLGQTQYSYSHQPRSAKYCHNCRRQIPFDSKLCPYCGKQQSSVRLKSKHPPPPKRDIKK